MPTVEDYVEEEEDQQQPTDSFVFDDDTDLPLPGTTPANPSNSTPRRALPNAGTRGALLSHIDDDEVDFDLAKIQAQGRGIENVGAPAASSRSATVTRSTDDGSNRPTAPAGGMPGMGGIMGDLMKIQEAEDQRMRKLEKQLGSTRFVKDPEEFKRWHSIYPIYFDAKATTTTGRRVTRQKSLWWPQSFHIAKACSSLGLETVHEIEKCHPSDWKNPGRVKVRLERDGQPVHRDIKNRTQLYNIVATQMQRQNASLVYTKPPREPSSSSSKPQAVAKQPSATSGSKAKPKKSAKSGTAPAPSKPSSSTVKPGPRPPRPPHPYPSMEDRFPLNSPLLALGVAVEAVKRDVEQEKENLKKGIGAPGGGAGADGEGKGQPKMPKMKKIMVRKR
ncbi:hypothetical protein FFLO_01711 [Filobasidium floriforme]|uniref:Signal recognition particle protein n=1 Tax=Filobasidium floriforme TaxID=5210 RepID=A0A8K0JPT3_9TREE|nr:uncharacterized protein HD553DRAFT_217461 [Filobasidium floriforme]KAG7562882.1 hypothetical protein FFLO_01711 [Filobasidium floriforme]KAH8086428.1 hypothetical protein HD553DRAFT_217461 [Filobasidium floriforme]